MTLRIRRDGAERDVAVTPVAKDGTVGRIGVDARQRAVDGPAAASLDAVQPQLKHNVESAGLIFKTLGASSLGEASPQAADGPVGIAQLSGGRRRRAGRAVRADGVDQPEPRPPQPAADPGARRRPHLHHGARGVARRDFSLRVKEKMLMAGFVLLMTLMVTVIYNDLMRIEWIRTLMPWR